MSLTPGPTPCRGHSWLFGQFRTVFAPPPRPVHNINCVSYQHPATREFPGDPGPCLITDCSAQAVHAKCRAVVDWKVPNNSGGGCRRARLSPSRIRWGGIVPDSGCRSPACAIAHAQFRPCPHNGSTRWALGTCPKHGAGGARARSRAGNTYQSPDGGGARWVSNVSMVVAWHVRGRARVNGHKGPWFR